MKAYLTLAVALLALNGPGEPTRFSWGVFAISIPCGRSCHDAWSGMFAGCSTTSTTPAILTQEQLLAQEADRQAREADHKAQAEQGDPKAQYHLYQLTSHDTERLKWLCRAANQSYPDALDRLGTAYRFGWSLEEDLVQAYKWYTLGIGAGSKVAPRYRDVLAATMTPVQIAEGERLAAEWAPESPCP